MKRFRIVALGLILSLLMPVSAWASTYLAVGDSIAFGTGASQVSDYNNYTNYPLKGTETPFKGYTDRLFEYLQANKGVETYVNASKNGITSAQLFGGLTAFPGLIPLEKTDFITINVGANDLLAPLQALVSSNPRYLTEPGYLEKQLKTLSPEIRGLISTLTTSSIQFKSNWKDIMNNLRKTNKSNATIIVNTVYNPFPVGSTLYFFATPFLATINTTIRSMAKTYGYKVADVKIMFDLLYSSKKPLIHYDIINDPVALHPTDLGYSTIYNLNKLLVPRTR